jgi:ABC-2 type transport system ATP-binding protein
MNPIIKVDNLVKEFAFAIKREKGFFSNLVKPEKKTIRAVDGISFEVNRGEILAFIGPNGAGKSTTIKILTSILHQTSGAVSVAGFNPQQERKKLAFKIGTVFGQRSQLMFNLPLRDSFELFGKIYELNSAQIKARTLELIELFDLGEFADQPVRKLSLGQRMRAEIALSLLHSPEIIFLDEPTIGLDVVAKRKLRETLLSLNKELQTTIFLTSHDAGDIEALCKRTIIINHGKIVVDSDTAAITREYFTEKVIRLTLVNPVSSFNIAGVEVVSQDGVLTEFKVDTLKYSLHEIMKEITARFEIADITVQDPPLEDIIGYIYERQH